MTLIKEYPMKYLMYLLMLCLVVACGPDSTGPGQSNRPVTLTLNGDSVLAPSDTSAGETIPITFKVIEVLDDDPVPMIVHFTVDHGGSLSVVEDTTDANFEITTDWTFGGFVGPQSIVAEFYYLNGTRLTGYGWILNVHPGKVAHLTMQPDSILTFAGEFVHVLPRVVTVTDSFGNARPLGDYTVSAAGGTWTIAGDSARADTAQVAGLVLSAGITAETLFVRAEDRYLDTRTFAFSYGCRIVNRDMYSTGTTGGLLYPGDSGYNVSYGRGRPLLVLNEQRVYDGNDTTTISFPVHVKEWYPDSIVWEVGTAVRQGTSWTFSGGSWCDRFGNDSTLAAPVLVRQ